MGKALGFAHKEREKTVDRLSTNTAYGTARRAAWWRFAAAAACFAMATSSALAAVEAETSLTNRIVCTTAPVNYNADGNPARVFASGNFVFVLEQWNARVAVYDLAGRTNLFYYGAVVNNGDGEKYTISGKWKMGTGEGGFKKPFGMALDTFSGENRFAVADTGNNRVQLFSFDASTGEITFVAASGAIFTAPNAVAFTAAGDILVADTGASRVVRLSVSGSSLQVGDTYLLGDKAYVTGICSDSASSEGFWVTDTRNRRVAYYRIADGTAAPAVSISTDGDRNFGTAYDVQVFGDSDNGKFLAVADYGWSRVSIVEAVAAGGAYTDVVGAGDVGSQSDSALQEYEKLWHPAGVFVADGTLYVADYGHNLIKWYGVTATSTEPPEPPKYFNFLSVATFDEAGAPCTEFTNHQTIALVVTFDTDDQIERALVNCNANGTTFVSIPNPTVSSDTISCDNIANKSNVQPYYGPIDLVITAKGAEGTYTTNVVAAYTLVESDQPEETEEVPWDFTSIAVADGVAALAWTLPTAAEGLPSDGACDFRIEWRTSLTEGAWSAAADSYMVEDVSTAAGCAYQVDLSAIGSPASCFFRLFWTNKAKE